MARIGGWLVLAVIAADSLAAHDLWIEPSTFAPPPGQPVAIRLRIGDRFQGDPVPRYDAGIARLAVLAPAGERALPGVEGVDPAGILASQEPGAHGVVYESRPRRLTLEAGRFERYLREEGLERIVALRQSRGESALPGRELYQRCAKTLLAVGGEAGGGWRRVAGCDLELLIESAPSSSAASGALALRLRFRGGPLAGALVSAVPRGRRQAALAARTDGHGRVSFAVDRPDVWLFTTVHMEPIADAGDSADWRSWWTSLTVRLEDG